MWDLWWSKWDWAQYFPVLHFPLPIAFHQLLHIHQSLCVVSVLRAFLRSELTKLQYARSQKYFHASEIWKEIEEDRMGRAYSRYEGVTKFMQNIS
jgi:hypothetical protein